MTWSHHLAALFNWWIDAVVHVVTEAVNGFRPPRRIEMLEGDRDCFTMRLLGPSRRHVALEPTQVRLAAGPLKPPSVAWADALRGSRIDLVLAPDRFLFRTLELPDRAAEFLDNVIRAQIDRLTPWRASQAAYHWTPPRALAGERIAVTIVATDQAPIASLAAMLSDAGAAAVAVATVTEEAERVCVYGARAAGLSGPRLIRSAVVGSLIAAVAVAIASVTASSFLVEQYDAQKQQIQRRMTDRLAILHGKSGASSAVALLEQRKQESAASVVVIEALSALLPDHTYATELRVQGDKLQVVGLTRDAPSLISLLEQSPHFSRAAFFAPTTHSAQEVGERFHIEATIKPYFGNGS